jgi:hypothetical protein
LAIIKNLIYFEAFKEFQLLRYFRINDPYRLLGLLGILLVIYLPLLIDAPPTMYPEFNSILVGEVANAGKSLYIDIVDQTAPLAGWFDAFFELIFGRSIVARHILVMFIILSQATYLGIVFINKKAFSESTFVPALISVILFSFSYDNFSLTPELLGSGFLLLALNNLFKEIEFREQRDEPVFNLGLFISFASLFSFPYAVFVIAAIVILGIFTRLGVRKYLLLIFGFLLPHLLLISIFYLRNGLGALVDFYYLPNLSFDTWSYVPGKSLWVLSILPLIFLVVSFVILNREARFTKYQSQLVQVMFFWLVFALLQAFYSKGLRPQNFITAIPAISFFVSHFLLLIRRRKFAEINIWVLFIGIVTIAYLARYGKLGAVRYDGLSVKESRLVPGVKAKKVLVLGHDPGVYLSNKPTEFLNWTLTREIFEHPEYYENVVRVSNAFAADAPDVIIDPQQLFKGYLERIPSLKKEYVLAGSGEYHRVVTKP